ncbi:MAG: 30S ribosomal protein S17 [Bacteroidetes bacterium]|nr:30S ribosomal protein S17 [Bacteroidota bacterium]
MTATAEQGTTVTRNTRKTRVGIVVSTKMNKTIIVTIERHVPHPLYKKYYKTTKRLHVHDEHSTAGVGDKVLIMETRPLSKQKRWRLVEIVERAR